MSCTNPATSFQDFHSYITGNLRDGRLTQEGLSWAVQQAGLTRFGDLAPRSDLIQTVHAIVGSIMVANAPKPPVYRDSRGIAWDARIHAGTKGLRDNGTWRRKHNVEPTLVNLVEAELIRRAVPMQPVPMRSVYVPVSSYRDLMARVDLLLWLGWLTPEALESVVKFTGLPSLSELVKQPELIPFIDRYIHIIAEL